MTRRAIVVEPYVHPEYGHTTLKGGEAEGGNVSPFINLSTAPFLVGLSLGYISWGLFVRCMCVNLFF